MSIPGITIYQYGLIGLRFTFRNKDAQNKTVVHSRYTKHIAEMNAVIVC